MAEHFILNLEINIDNCPMDAERTGDAEMSEVDYL
jgi:hypothetical protein